VLFMFAFVYVFQSYLTKRVFHSQSCIPQRFLHEQGRDHSLSHGPQEPQQSLWWPPHFLPVVLSHGHDVAWHDDHPRLWQRPCPSLHFSCLSLQLAPRRILKNDAVSTSNKSEGVCECGDLATMQERMVCTSE
jgi:hypothetical protein